MKFFQYIVYLSLCIFPLYGIAQTPELNTSGYGEVIAKPDMATFSVAVESDQKSAEQVKLELDKVVSAFLNKLNQEGIDKAALTSSNIRVTPHYQQSKTNEETDLIGYRGIRHVKVDVYNIDKLDDYLDVALDAGINRIDQIELKLQDDTLYRQKARTLAIQDAMAKAKAVANGFDTKLDGITQINYQTNSYRPVMAKSVMSGERSLDKSYQETQLIISDTVDVSYKLKTVTE